MSYTVSIGSVIGDDLRTRSFFRRDIEKVSSACNYDVKLDFSRVKFMSRSVADELCNILQEFPNIKSFGMAGEVKKMYDIVVRGRQRPREYSEVNAVAVKLSTLKEMEEYFSGF